MKKVIFKILILLNFAFISCSDKKVEFKVFNNTNNILDSLMISSSGTNYLEKSKILNLKPNTSSNILLDLANVEKTDGNYYLEVYLQKASRKMAFGYYSNGVPTASGMYEINIMKDTILIKEVFKK